MLATRGGGMNEPQNNAPVRPNGNGNAPADERNGQQNAAGAGAEAQDLRGAEAQRRREQALSRDTLSRTLRDFPLEDKFRIAQELRSQPDRRFAWTTYFKRSAHPDDEDITDDADSGTETNVRHYRYLADVMPPSSRAGPTCFRTPGFYFDDRDSGPIGTRNKEPLYTIAGVVEELQHRIEELSTEDFATLRKAEGHQEEQISDHDAAASLSRQLGRVVKSFNTHPHPVRNGKKALFLVRNFVCLKYPDEDCAFLILQALYQAAHQYGVNKENCDPLPIINSILTGRVSDADIECRGADEDKSDPTLLRNFLANLQDGTQAHNIVEDGQRRLSLLDAEDQRLLSSLYDKIINLDAVEYATNRLRGLFAKQILEDAQEVIDQKYGNNQHGADGTLGDVVEMPPGLLQILHDVYAVADKLTALFLNGDLMRDAFAPFGADAAGGGPSAKRQKA
eukprot:g2867.t1